MTKMIVAIDLSPGADRALRRATLLARRCGGRLVLAHVAGSRDGAGPFGIDDPGDARDRLADLQRTLRDVDGVESDLEMLSGELPVALVDLATRTAADLLLVGPHGQPGLIDQFRGTTAERLLRTAGLPLLVVNTTPTRDYRRVMLPTDLEPASASAARRLMTLPTFDRLEMLFLHIFDPIADQMLARSMVTGGERRSQAEEEIACAREALSDFLAAHALFGRGEPLVRAGSGQIRFDIANAAREHEVDLIALAPSNKGRIAKAIVGSVTEGLLRDGSHDLLVLPVPTD